MLNIINNNNQSRKITSFFIIITILSSSILYLNFPILTSFIILFMLFFISNTIIRRYSLLIIVFCSFNINLLNLIKFPKSDLAAYIQQYVSWGKLPLESFSQLIKSDFVFHYSNRLLYILSDGNVGLFVFFWTFIIYFLLSLSIRNLFLSDRIDKTSFVFSLIILFYSTTFLSLSSHLIRQMVTGAIFVYYITELFLNRKKNYLPFIMILTHFSSLLLIIPLIVRNKYFYFLFSLLTIYILITSQNIFTLISNNVPLINLDYINFLMTHVNGAVEKVKNDGDVSITTYFVSLLLLSFFGFQLLKEKNYELLTILIPFYFSFLLFNLFTPIQLLWLRFSFYQYPFYFILFGLFFTYFNKKFKMIIPLYWLMSLLYFIIFYNYFSGFNWINNNILINESMLSIYNYLNIF
jgi:hypothetical protein